LPHLFSAWLGSFFGINGAFYIYTLWLLLHFALTSIFGYLLFGNVLLAIAIAYCQRAIHLNQSIVYSWTWSIFSLLMLEYNHPILAGIGVYLAISGGYWPVVMFLAPFTLRFTESLFLLFITAGLLSLPQLIATFRYMKRSIRRKQSYKSKAQGSIPPWHLISFIWPLRFNLNGLLYPELSYRVGIIPLFACFLAQNALLSHYFWLGVLGVYLSMGSYVRAPIPLRIPNRAMYMTTIALCFLANPVISELNGPIYVMLCVIHMLDVLKNHDLFPFYPFMEKPGAPSDQFNPPVVQALKGIKVGRVSGLPHPVMTGHITGVRGLGYCGGCMLKEEADKRGITNENGESAHDWFKNKEDGDELDDFGITHAYKPSGKLKEGKWKLIAQDLYQNQNLLT